MFERDNGYLVVDEVFADVHMIDFVDVKIGDGHYRFRGIPAKRVTDDMLLPALAAAPHKGDSRQSDMLCLLYGLIPRNYKPSIGRAITPDEWNEIVERHRLSDDKISGEFDEYMPKCYGEHHSIRFTARQIETKEAIALEAALLEKGIEAFSGSSGRVTIRVK